MTAQHTRRRRLPAVAIALAISAGPSLARSASPDDVRPTQDLAEHDERHDARPDERHDELDARPDAHAAPDEGARAFRNDSAMAGRDARTGVAEAIYARPFVAGGSRVAIGGYVEAAGTWTKEEGVIEGTNFSLPRFNLFVYARVLPRIEFLAELEFENGGQEIKIENAQLDFTITEGLALRVGVLLIPLGGFNQDHDSPRWPLVDRPLVSETILPATLSEVGVGLHGERAFGELRLNGQFYVTNGLGDGIIGNETGRVDIPSGKHDGILALDPNGRPAVSGRAALLWGDAFEFGVSAYHSAYNVWTLEGEAIDERRTLTLGALDLRAEFWRLELRGELAMAWIQLPDHARDIYARRQYGWHVDLYADLFRHTLGTGTNARLRAVVRGERADYFLGNFQDGSRAGDTLTGLTVGLAWQLDQQLVIRAGVRQRWARDVLNNPATREVQAQLGVASYF